MRKRKMDVYRQNSVPVIYTWLPFIRHSKNNLIADIPEDTEDLNRLKMVASGKYCISTLEGSDRFIVKCQFPDDILQKEGNTGSIIKWQYYHWKLWDVESLINGIEPTEAVTLEQAGIDRSYLREIASDSSCIPLLQKVQGVFDYGKYKGYRLSEIMENKIIEEEKRIVSVFQLNCMKHKIRKKAAHTKDYKMALSVTPSHRDRILRRDGYRCTFCGKHGAGTRLEVNHIIPKSIISKLNLKQKLITSDENLCTTCFECNRGKTDNLAKETIDFYINIFGKDSHPNYDIVKYLQTIRELQGRE